MRADLAADLTIGAQGLIHDALDGADAAAALRTATQTSVNLACRTRRIFARQTGLADIAVTQDVARTDNHDPAAIGYSRQPSIGFYPRGKAKKPCLHVI